MPQACGSMPSSLGIAAQQGAHTRSSAAFPPQGPPQVSQPTAAPTASSCVGMNAVLHLAAEGCPTTAGQVASAGACSQACPSPALLPSWGSAELPDVTAPRWRSGTPEDAMQPGPASRQRGEPITPAAAAHHAPATPTAGRCCGAAADTCTAGAPVASVVASRPPSSVAFAEALWRRAQSFMQCVAGSPLAHSALLSLELAGTHPAVPQGSGLPSGRALQWTLAQLLAMHLKSGLPQASEATLLASLWLLESLDNCRRSAATVCLNDYVRHLAAFSQQAVLEITTDWPSSFRRLRQNVVDAQRHLLQHLDWRVLPDPETEVPLCHAMLFQGQTGLWLAGAACEAGTAAAGPWGLWAGQMHRLCVDVLHQAHMIRRPARLADRLHASCGETATQSPTKRQRTHA
ncbi:hypothetical protein ABPG77_009667 [Micractinium sp. CCAP 211/92]